MLLWRRFIDDILLAYGGTREQFDQYMVEINGIHPTIKFTSECSDEQVTFLDVAVHKGERFRQNGVLDVKTYIKPTNKQMYIHNLVSPQRSVVKPLRYLRTNSSKACFSQAIAKHKRVLKSRGYNPMVTNKLSEQSHLTSDKPRLSPRPYIGMQTHPSHLPPHTMMSCPRSGESYMTSGLNCMQTVN